MFKNLSKFLWVSLILTVLIFPVLAQSKDFSCKVTDVYDGDTFTCQNNSRVRVWGVDTPEIPTIEALKAKQYIEKIILNNTLSCQTKGSSYNRVVAQCFLDNKDIAIELLESKNAVEMQQYSKGYYSKYSTKASTEKICSDSGCGNGNCTQRTDKKGRPYCTCKGRKGRAKLKCCS